MGRTFRKGEFDARKDKRERQKQHERKLKILRKQLKREGKDASVVDQIILRESTSFDDFEES